MKLAEYRLGDRTYLFDTENVPAGAELVTNDVAVEPVNLFPDQTDVSSGEETPLTETEVEADKNAAEAKAKPKPANKQAPATDNKE